MDKTFKISLILCLLAKILFASCTTNETDDIISGGGSNPPPSSHTAFRNCITEYEPWYNSIDIETQKRLDVYKAMGVEVIRVSFSWRDIETSKGQWDEQSRLFRYIEMAKSNGLKIKLVLGIAMDPPQWYFKENPTARYRNNKGETTNNAISLWYPGLQDVIKDKTEKMVSILKSKDLWDCIEYIIPALGSAGEPNYPPQWTTGLDSEAYWFYDENAQKSFQEYAKNIYSDISSVNSAWGTNYSSLKDIAMQQPGANNSTYWKDLLTWYRDSKRDFVKWTIAYTASQLRADNKKIVIYIPGVQLTKAQWDIAINSKGKISAPSVMLMEDSDYLIDYAHENKFMLQYTGLTPGEENKKEISRIKKYMRDNGFLIEIWGENVGDEWTATQFISLKEQILSNSLFAIDYTKSNYLFKSDRVTPIEDRINALKDLNGAISEKYE